MFRWQDAANGKIATMRLEAIKPDLAILDIEMPEMDSLQVLEFIRGKKLPTKAIMLSSLTQAGSKQTIRALELGAFDFIPKPQTDSMEQSRKQVKADLTRIVEAFDRHRKLRRAMQLRLHLPQLQVTTQSQTPQRPAKRPAQGPSTLNLIGVSTGGPNALKQVLPSLPADLGLPVLVVQHMPPVFTRSLAESLTTQCQIPVFEAEQGQQLQPNQILIAPGGRQMGIKPGQVLRPIPDIIDR